MARAKKLKKKKKNGTTVALVGFGYIGTCIGAVLAESGLRVHGIDVRKNVVDAINHGDTHISEPGLTSMVKKVVSQKRLSASTSYEAISECDVVVVTVGTPLSNNFEPDTKDIVSAISSIKPFLKDGQLIVLKSTVPPMLTENTVKSILDATGKKYYLAFSPERLAEGRAIAELKTVPMVVGGVDAESSKRTAAFWKKALGVKTIIVDNAKTAEFVKLADNLWIDLNIALANELAQLADKFGIDATQAIAAANTLQKGAAGHFVNILAPSVGVGGYCLTKDPWFVHFLGEKQGLDLKTPRTSRAVNDAMPAYSFSVMKGAIELSGRSMEKSSVAILGLAFKNNTGDTRFTPAAHIVKEFEKSGCTLSVCDPLVSAEDAVALTEKSLTHDPRTAMKGADAVIFLTGHDLFKKLSVKEIIRSVRPKAVIYDGRNFFDRAAIKQFRAAGLIYKGVGR